MGDREKHINEEDNLNSVISLGINYAAFIVIILTVDILNWICCLFPLVPKDFFFFFESSTFEMYVLSYHVNLHITVKVWSERTTKPI